MRPLLPALLLLVAIVLLTGCKPPQIPTIPTPTDGASYAVNTVAKADCSPENHPNLTAKPTALEEVGPVLSFPAYLIQTEAVKVGTLLCTREDLSRAPEFIRIQEEKP